MNNDNSTQTLAVLQVNLYIVNFIILGLKVAYYKDYWN